MRTLILYFSGTGNTAYTAGLFKSALLKSGVESDLFSIEKAAGLEKENYDFLLLGFPKYYEYIPHYFLNYLKYSLPAGKKETPALAFCTQAGPMTTDFGVLEKILARKNYRLTVTKSFPFANNMPIIKAFKPTDEATLKEHIKYIVNEVPLLTAALLSGSEKKESIGSSMAFLDRAVAGACTGLMPLFAMKYAASGDCTGCGLCAKNCPAGNIKMEGKTPRFFKKCIFCMRCINMCPNNAITYKGRKCEQYRINFK